MRLMRGIEDRIPQSAKNMKTKYTGSVPQEGKHRAQEVFHTMERVGAQEEEDGKAQFPKYHNHIIDKMVGSPKKETIGR